MTEIFAFIFKFLGDIVSFLFTIDLGDGLSLGSFLSVVFFVFPLILFIVNMLKGRDD